MKETHALAGRRVSILFVSVLFCFVLVRELLLSTALMPFQGWDEYQHLAVAEFVDENGHMPLLTDLVPVRMYPFLCAHPHPDDSAKQLPGLGARNYSGMVWYDGKWQSPASVTLKPRNYRLYQAQHGPVYYHFLVLMKNLFGLDDFLTWADAARMANSLFSACTAVLWFLVLRRFFHEGVLSALPYLLCTALASYSVYAFNHARIANDALANMLGCASLLLYLALLPRLDSSRLPRVASGIGILGLLVGAAAVTKWNLAVLAPVVVLGLLYRAYSMRIAFRRCMLSIAVFTAGYLLVTAPVHIESYRNYGTATAMQEAVHNSKEGKGVADIMGAVPHIDFKRMKNVFLMGMLHMGGWSGTTPHQLPMKMIRWIIWMSVLLFFVSLIPSKSRSRVRAVISRSPELLLLLFFLSMAMMYHAAHSQLAWGMVATNPWYGIPAFPALILLLLLGAYGLSRRLAGCLTLILVLVHSWTYYQGTFIDLLHRQVPESSGPGEAFAAVLEHHSILGLPLEATLLAEAGLLIVLVGIGLYVSFRRNLEEAA